MPMERRFSVHLVLASLVAVLYLSSCDAESSGAPTTISSGSSGLPTTMPTTTVEAVGTSVVADEGCTVIAPWALDAWAFIDAHRGLVVQAHVVSADPPVNAATKYGEYVMQRLNLENVETIFSARGTPADAREMVVLIRPVDPAKGSAGPLAVDDLVRAPEVIINAFTDTNGPTFVGGAAVVESDESVHFLGYCSEGSQETLATMMEQLPSTDSWSERDVLVDWIRERYGVPATG